MTTLQDRQQLIEILKELDGIHISLSDVHSKLAAHNTFYATASLCYVNDALHRIDSWRREIRRAILFGE
jgi:hypothetical protein